MQVETLAKLVHEGYRSYLLAVANDMPEAWANEPSSLDDDTKARHEAARKRREEVVKNPSPCWDDCDEWEKDCTIAAINFYFAKILEPDGFSCVHDCWIGYMVGEGWHCGPLVNGTVKQHAWMVGWPDLLPVQQMKYRLMNALCGLYA